MPDATIVPPELIGQIVVLDTPTQFVYIGRLAGAGAEFIELQDADVHDSAQSPSPNEIYIIDARKYGVKKNRVRVFVRYEQIVSVSRLEDVIEY